MGRRVADDTWKRTVAGLSTLVERITPWLLDLGNWIFGALIAFNLVILGALLTVGPVDPAVLIATAAFALALPLDAAGFVLLRFVTDMKNVDLEQVATKAFEEVGFSRFGDSDPSESAKRRTAAVLRYSYMLLALTFLLTLIGVTAALWHMSWWIGVLFVAMVIVSQAIVFIALVSTGPKTNWRSPAGDVEPEKT